MTNTPENPPAFDLNNPPFNKIHHAVCPLCHFPLDNPKYRVFNVKLGEVHKACILLEMLAAKRQKQKESR